MKKTVKIMSVLICISLIATLFAGCGSKKSYTVSEIINKGQSIWYLVDDVSPIGRESNIDLIYAFNDDGTLIYWEDPETESGEDYNLGYFAQMEDKDIIRMVQEHYEKAITDKADRILENLFTNMRGVSEENLQYAFQDYFSDIQQHEEDIYYFVDMFDDVYNMMSNDTIDPTKTYYLNEAELNSCADKILKAFPVIKECIDKYYPSNNYKAAGTECFKTISESLMASDEYKNNTSVIEEMKKDVTPVPFKMGLESDSTGNAPAAEGIFPFEKPIFDYLYDSDAKTITYQSKLSYKFTIINSPIAYAEDGNCVQIYDSFFGGFYTENQKHAWVTRFDKNVTLSLDQLDAKDIIVDPIDEEAIISAFGDSKTYTIVHINKYNFN